MLSRIRTTGFTFWALFFLVVSGLIACVWWVSLSGAFRVSNIEISGNAFLTDKEINGYLNDSGLEGRHVWFANFKAVAKDLMENPRITAAFFKRGRLNKVRLVLEEAEEFATLKLLNGEIITVGRDGKPVRELEEDEPIIGSLICGFTDEVFYVNPPVGEPRAEREIWSGLHSDPDLAGKLRDPPGAGQKDYLREGIRYAGALRLAEATRIDRGREISGYEYVGLDGNYDLYLSYENRPPIVVGGFIEAHDIVMEINSILDYDGDPELWGKYDYIDLHMPKFARGICLAEMEKGPEKKWSDEEEAVSVAAWKIMVEVDRRLGK
jgi:hypothetical protein